MPGRDCAAQSSYGAQLLQRCPLLPCCTAVAAAISEPSAAVSAAALTEPSVVAPAVAPATMLPRPVASASSLSLITRPVATALAHAATAKRPFSRIVGSTTATTLALTTLDTLATLATPPPPQHAYCLALAAATLTSATRAAANAPEDRGAHADGQR